MELNLLGNSGSLSLSDDVFDVKYNETLIHQVVTAYLAAGRAGTKAQKSRSGVRGGGIKPWRQKGTGRARAGTSRSPIWRSGGVTFASQPRNYAQKVNRKMYQTALRSILSELVRKERLVVVESFSIDAPKTKTLVAKLKELEMSNVLIVDVKPDENLYLACRNLYKVEVAALTEIDPVSLISFERVLITSSALKELEGRLS